MIEAIIKSAGALVNKPNFYRIVLEDENIVAVRRKDEETNKVQEFTIKQLFDASLKTSNYLIAKGEIDQHLFKEWFSQKYIKGTSLETRIIGIEFNRK